MRDTTDHSDRRSPGIAPENALARLAAQVQPEVEAIALAAAAAIKRDVAAYPQSSDPTLDIQVAQHCRSIFALFLECMTQNRSPMMTDFPFSADVALFRVTQGIALADFLRAFRIAQITFWKRLVAVIRAIDATQEVITRTVELLLEVIELGSSAAGAAYLEAEQYRLADNDRIRRDLVEDLIARRTPIIGPRRGMLSAAGLDPDSAFMACSANAVATNEDDAVIRRLRAVIRAALSSVYGGIVVARHLEVVVICREPVDSEGLYLALRAARHEMKRSGLEIAIGISTVHRGWDEVPEAYREACSVRDALGDAGGVQALASMSVMNYVTLSDDATLQQLIDPRIAAFVDEELASDGAHLHTLDAFVASDLNAKLAAERLHVHVNTAYYRLDRIAARTGVDLRRFDEVMELVFVVRLLRSRRVRRSRQRGPLPPSKSC